MKLKKTYLEYIGFALPLLLALACLASVTLGSYQASLPIPMPQELVGEYSYDGENWHPLTEDAELSAREDTLFLRGHFLRDMQQGGELKFYCDHISVLVRINGETVYADDIRWAAGADTDIFASMCAQEWMGFPTVETTAADEVEIELYNPHRYGNENAYREFLDTLCVEPQGTDILEKNLEAHGRPFRTAGGLLAVTSLMLLGAAVAAVAVSIPVGGTLLKMGLMTLFAAGFICFDTVDASYWSELNALNTYARGLCMMLAALCFGFVVSDALGGRVRRIAKCVVLLSAGFDGVLIVLAFMRFAVIFDLLPYWVVSEVIVCLVLVVCCAAEMRKKGRGDRLMPLSGILLAAAILWDIAGVGGTMVWRSPWSKIVFAVLFVIHTVVAAKGIVKNHRASIRAERLEKELEESRIAIMLSQIKPHFLYNVLNTIYHLYRKEPEVAQEAVSSFAEYLRCNMLSIEKNELIPFSEEYQHIQTYLSLEQIRFRGRLDVVYDVEFSDFKLPPLTVEPLVENAVKHGVTKKRGGGIVTISTRRTETGYVVAVSDTGVGFDPEDYMGDGKSHIGIRNVRERLQRMANGTLSITSTSGGTTAVVTIPAKEANQKHEDHRG